MGSGGGSSGSSASKTYISYGSIAALVGHGPYVGLKAILVDKKVAWSGPILRATSPNPVPLSIEGYGPARWYWGLPNQPQDQLLSGPWVVGSPGVGNDLGHVHPTYDDLSYLVFDRFKCGKGRDSFPDIEVIGWRKPVQSLITGPAADLDADLQANPFVIAAELLTAEWLGLEYPLASFVQPAWQAAADYALANHEATYCTTLLNSQVDARAMLDRLMALVDGFMRPHRSTGALEAGYFPPPAEILVDTLRSFKKTSLTELPKWSQEDWADVKTRVTVKYTSADKNFKTLPTSPVENPAAREKVGFDVPEIVDRPDITRTAQATEYAQRYLQRVSAPKGKGELTERRELVEEVKPGDHITIDIEPETSGAQKQQVCRVTKITRPRTGEAKLEVETEPSLQPVTVLPPVEPPEPPPEPTTPDILHARLFEVPVGLAGATHTIGVLASRPDGLVTAFVTHYDKDSGGFFPQLGATRAFGLRARLNAALASGSADPVSVELLDALDQRLVSEDPGDAAARNDDVLMLVFKIGVSGQIAADAEDKAWIEIFSCEAFASTAPGVIAVTALRGRRGTPARDFAQHDEVWFIRREDLTQLTHADFSTLTPSIPAYFKLQPVGAGGERPLEDCLLRTFNFALERDEPPSDDDDGITPDPVLNVQVTNAIQLITLRWEYVANTPLAQVDIYESDTNVRPLSPQFTVLAPQTWFFRGGLQTTDTRYFWLRAKGRNGRYSTIVGPFTGQAGPNVSQDVQDALDQLEQDLAQEGTNRTNQYNGLLDAIADQADDFEALVEQKKTEAIQAAATDATAKANAAVTAAVGPGSAMANRADALEATVNDPTTGLAVTRARVIANEETFATKDYAIARRDEAISAAATDATAKANAAVQTAVGPGSAMAARANALEATVNDPNTGLPATRGKVTILTDALVDAGGTVRTRFGALLQAASNGDLVQTGWEMIAENAPDRVISAIRMLANVLQLRSSINGQIVYPFQVIDGSVWMNTALIKDATITSAMIQNLVADKIAAGTISAAILMTAAKFQSANIGTDYVIHNPAHPNVTLPRDSSAASIGILKLVGIGAKAADATAAYNNWQYWLGQYNTELAAYNQLYAEATSDAGWYDHDNDPETPDEWYDGIDPMEQDWLDTQMALVATANSNRIYWEGIYNATQTPIGQVFGRSQITFIVTGVVGFSGTAGDIHLRYRINGGAWQHFGYYLITQGTNPNALAQFPLTLNLALTDTIEFYPNWSAPGAAGTYISAFWFN